MAFVFVHSVCMQCSVFYHTRPLFLLLFSRIIEEPTLTKWALIHHNFKRLTYTHIHNHTSGERHLYVLWKLIGTNCKIRLLLHAWVKMERNKVKQEMWLRWPNWCFCLTFPLERSISVIFTLMRVCLLSCSNVLSARSRDRNLLQQLEELLPRHNICETDVINNLREIRGTAFVRQVND